MSIWTLFIYMISSVILNIGLNKLESKKKDNIIDYVVISNIYVVVLSGVFDYYSLTNNNDNIFFIVLFQILGRILYLTVVRERTVLRNSSYQLKKYLITLVSCYFLNILIINQMDNILPSEEIIKLLIWLFIVGYVFLYVKKNIDVRVPVDDNVSFYQDREYVVMQYAKYKSRYDNLVSSKYEDVTLLIYAIMIYENYNRPELMRKIDILKYKLFRETGKFGIMQVDKNKVVSNEESIEIVRKKLERIYTTNYKNKDKVTVSFLIQKYYKSEKDEVKTIYEIIKEFIKK